jgi:ABC-2 type transport system permease protein
MLAVFRKDLLLLLRDPTAVPLLVLAPIALISIVTLGRSRSSEPPRPSVVVVDEDEGPVAGAFVQLLEERADVTHMTEAEATRAVAERHRAPAAIVFPEGLSKRYLQQRESTVTVLTDPAQALGLADVRALLLTVDRDAAELADPLHEELLVFTERSLGPGGLSPKSREQNVPGFTLMFVLLAMVFGASSALHDERGWRTLPRLLASPVSAWRVVAGSLGMRVVVGIVQGLVLLVWGRLVLGVSLGTAPAALVLLIAATTLAAAALGLVVGAVAATREQTLPLSLAATLGLAALCGLWWPLSLVPSWLRTVGELFFPTWAMYGLTDLILRDQGLAGIAWPLAVTTLEGVLLLGLALLVLRARGPLG